MGSNPTLSAYPNPNIIGMYELKQIDVWSLVKIVSILSFALGLVIGFIYLLMILFISQISSSLMGDFDPEMMQIGGFVGFFMVFFIAILTSLFYTVVTAILAVLYNGISGFTGGIRIRMTVAEVEQSSQPNV
ncbi:DUF3566 domain-containing protein [candidate division KSB1 bacterium]|nr:DUF3566 domain-containing protein [candidate division KSB1 bacterium]